LPTFLNKLADRNLTYLIAHSDDASQPHTWHTLGSMAIGDESTTPNFEEIGYNLYYKSGFDL